MELNRNKSKYRGHIFESGIKHLLPLEKSTDPQLFYALIKRTFDL